MNLPEYISTFGVILVALFLVWKEYRSGSNTLNSQVVANYKMLDEQQKIKIKERDDLIAQYQKDIKDINISISGMKETFAKQIGDLQGQITAKDKQITDLQATILNRNPELENLLKEIHQFMKGIHEQNKYQTNMLEDQIVRDDNIDRVTQGGQGKVLRKTNE